MTAIAGANRGEAAPPHDGTTPKEHQPADDRCPRCGAGFHCGRHGAGPCPCTTVQLSADTLADLQRQHAGCLCLRCLHELARVEQVRTAAAR